jgi:hypothetical protein
MERFGASMDILVDYITSASLEREKLMQESGSWQIWADQFFTMMIDNSSGKEHRSAVLTQFASSFTPRRYAVMIEMLGVYAEGTDRAGWLSEFAKPFLDAHTDQPEARAEFFKWISLSSVPDPIKDGMIRTLHTEYGDLDGSTSGIIFMTDARTRDPKNVRPAP